MPTDGTIFLEALPKRKHYLLTALSVFFAAGSVVSSIMGLILVPANSCGGARVCDVANNKGWRWLLASLGFFVSDTVDLIDFFGFLSSSFSDMPRRFSLSLQDLFSFPSLSHPNFLSRLEDMKKLDLSFNVLLTLMEIQNDSN